MTHYDPEDFKHLNTENKSNTPVNIKDLWQTPFEIFNKLDREFNFNFDVAASESNKLCKLFFDENFNALDASWGVTNWCNPPYSDITPWINKAIETVIIKDRCYLFGKDTRQKTATVLH